MYKACKGAPPPRPNGSVKTAMARDRYRILREAFPDVRRDGKRFCSWCGAQLTGRKLRWCSSKCAWQATTRCSPAAAARRCYKEANGICQRCGLNIEALTNALVLLRWEYHEPIWRDFTRHLNQLMKQRGWDKWDSLWHAHHITPHAHGGTLEPENLILLCVPCHKAVHAKDKPCVTKSR